MRIIYLHQYFSMRIGGTRSYEMARRLVAMGHHVEMITADCDVVPRARSQWYCTEEDGIHVHWLPVPYANRMGYRDRLKAFARFAWSASWRAASLGGDLVFATSTPLTIALPAIYAARKNRIPMVFEVRDLWPEVPIALGALRNPVAIAAARLLERLAYRNAKHVVALSPGMKAGITATGYPEERVTVIPNACDVELFDVGAEAGRAVRREHPWLRDRPLVIYTGALGRVNHVAYLARLAAEVARLDPDVCFVVIGDGKEEDLVRRTAAELRVLERNFFMLPSVPKSAIARWLSAADLATSVVLDVPALWANSANKVFDALAAGKPVVINYGGWQAQLLRDTGAGLVLHPRDVVSSARALLSTLRDSQWLACARATARRLARGRFRREHLAEQLEGVLSAAHADSRRSRRATEASRE